jgi:hypothetical protein
MPTDKRYEIMDLCLGFQSVEAPALIAIFLGLSQFICLPRSKKLAHFEFPGSKPGFACYGTCIKKGLYLEEKQVSVLKQPLTRFGPASSTTL